MHATLRRLQCAPGKASEMAGLIEAEYVPQLRDLDGAVSYTLVLLDGDIVTSVGVFASEDSAVTANELAVAWVKQDHIAALGASPLEASQGAVGVHATFDG